MQNAMGDIMATHLLNQRGKYNDAA